MVVELKKLSRADGVDIYNMLQEIPKEENGYGNSVNGLSYDEYKQWLIYGDNCANGIGLEDWMVPQTAYWLYVDGKPIGMGKLRHYLTEKLKEDGGHIGYTISPTYRNCGYGKLLLGLLIDEAEKMGINRVLVTIENHNTASQKVAISNGGIIEKINDIRHFIWIDCKNR